MHRLVVCMLGVLLSLAPLASAQWAVVDVAAIAQSFQNTLQTAAVVANTAKEIQAQYNIILQQIHQVEIMTENMQRIPEGLNFFEMIQTIGSNVSGLLGAATLVSYDLDNAMRQFQTLYVTSARLNNPTDVLAFRQRLLAAKLEASGTTVSVTAIRQNLTDVYTRLCALLNGSWTAHGALDSAQIAAQQAGFQQSSLASLTAIQATHARSTAQGEAERATLEQANLQAIQGAMRDTTPATFVPQGHLPTIAW